MIFFNIFLGVNVQLLICDMEGGEVMLNGATSNGYGSGVSCRNGLEKVCNGSGLEHVYGENGLDGTGASENVKGNLEDVVLENMEEYFEDIDDTLVISRMVSDSVVKGMVTAIEQDCAEKVAAKELEVASLKENLQTACSTSLCKKREKVRGELSFLRDLVREQFKDVKKEIECVTGTNSLKKIGSGSELVGLGGILLEKHSENGVSVDKMLHCLKTTLDTVWEKVDDTLLCCGSSICDCKQQANSAKQTKYRSPREEFDENFFGQNFQLCGIQNMNWLEKFNDVATLGTKLDAIQKSLSMPDVELVSHGSHEFDNLQHKASGNLGSLLTSLSGENGTVDGSNVHVAETYDFQQLKHMNKEELVAYFNNIIVKIKRDHESDQHQKTDQLFQLKRDYLKLKGSIFTHMKDEEFDALRKKFSEVISKLEDFLSENERFPALTTNLESLESMKHRVENLQSENHRLRDCLNEKENEVNCLKEEVSGAASEILQRSLTEQNLLKVVESLQSAAEDSCIEASLNDVIYKSALREQIAFREAAVSAETAKSYAIEDSDITSLITQDLNALLFTEVIRDAGLQLDNLRQKVLSSEEVKTCLERKWLEKENEFKLEVEEKEKLKQEILELRIAMEHKEKLAMDMSVSLLKEREQYELASQEIITSRERANLLETLVTEKNKDLESLRSQHQEALEQIEVYKMEMNKLNQELAQTEAVITEANRERSRACTRVQEMHDKLSLSEAREQTIKQEMEMAANRFSKLFAEFEWRVSGAIRSSNSRYISQPCVSS